MEFTITFTCYKCTRTGSIRADSVEGCYRIAHNLGWRQATPIPGDTRDPDTRTICFRCPGGNAKGNLTLGEAEWLEKRIAAKIREETAIREAAIQKAAAWVDPKLEPTLLTPEMITDDTLEDLERKLVTGDLDAVIHEAAVQQAMGYLIEDLDAVQGHDSAGI